MMPLFALGRGARGGATWSTGCSLSPWSLCQVGNPLGSVSAPLPTPVPALFEPHPLKGLVLVRTCVSGGHQGFPGCAEERPGPRQAVSSRHFNHRCLSRQSHNF